MYDTVLYNLQIVNVYLSHVHFFNGGTYINISGLVDNTSTPLTQFPMMDFSVNSSTTALTTKLWLWISNFLKQRVVVDGIQSDLVTVNSGVPQGTVLGPILFLLHINDLPSVISSKVRLFADDCLVYREIKNRQDQIALQKDLNLLENWGSKWGMRFNAASVTLCECPESKPPFPPNMSCQVRYLRK